MGSERTVCIADSEYVLARFPILLHKDRHMELFIFKEGEPLVETVRQQVVEAVQLAVNIWSTQHDEVDVTELVRAIDLVEQSGSGTGGIRQKYYEL